MIARPRSLVARLPTYGHKPLPRLFDLIGKRRLSNFGLRILDPGISEFLGLTSREVISELKDF